MFEYCSSSKLALLVGRMRTGSIPTPSIWGDWLRNLRWRHTSLLCFGNIPIRSTLDWREDNQLQRSRHQGSKVHLVQEHLLVVEHHKDQKGSLLVLVVPVKSRVGCLDLALQYGLVLVEHCRSALLSIAMVVAEVLEHLHLLHDPSMPPLLACRRRTGRIQIPSKQGPWRGSRRQRRTIRAALSS